MDAWKAELDDDGYTIFESMADPFTSTPSMHCAVGKPDEYLDGDVKEPCSFLLKTFLGREHSKDKKKRTLWTQYSTMMKESVTMMTVMLSLKDTRPRRSS